MGVDPNHLLIGMILQEDAGSSPPGWGYTFFWFGNPNPIVANEGLAWDSQNPPKKKSSSQLGGDEPSFLGFGGRSKVWGFCTKGPFCWGKFHPRPSNQPVGHHGTRVVIVREITTQNAQRFDQVSQVFFGNLPSKRILGWFSGILFRKSKHLISGGGHDLFWKILVRYFWAWSCF